MTAADYGPWIEHDGLSCPPETIDNDFIASGVVWPDENGHAHMLWLWWMAKEGTPGTGRIYRYRLKKNGKTAPEESAHAKENEDA